MEGCCPWVERLRAPVQPVGQDLVQVFRHHRFGDVVVHAGLQAAFAILGEVAAAVPISIPLLTLIAILGLLLAAALRGIALLALLATLALLSVASALICHFRCSLC